MDDEVKKKIDELSKRASRIIANPEDIKKLLNYGLQIETVPPAKIEAMFNERSRSVEAILEKLPPIPKMLLPPAIATLYNEIRECILFHLNGAAITLSGILIEFTLKHTIFIFESGGYQKYDPLKWDEFEKMNFGNAINRAKEIKFIETEIADKLDSFRIDTRNPYSHYNIKNITRNVIAGNVDILNISTGEHITRDIAAKESPIIQAQVKPWVDSQRVLAVFMFTDGIVRYLMVNLYDKLPKNT